MSPAILEQHVLSKPYFDRQGLILAVDGSVPLGFVHVGFGANQQQDEVNESIAVVSMLMVSKSTVPEEMDRRSIAATLLEQAEAYAQSRNSRVLLGGGAFPNNPFYLGLYGGSRLPGILAEDEFSCRVFKDAGYQVDAENGIWQRELAGFRTVTNRQQMQIRRSYNVQAGFDPNPKTWWEACTLGHAERTRFELYHRGSDAHCGEVTFWDMQPLATHWGVSAAGMFDIWIQPELRRQGLATFLIGEALRQLKENGATVAEVQTRMDNSSSIALFEKLGFEKIDRGILFFKNLEP